MTTDRKASHQFHDGPRRPRWRPAPSRGRSHRRKLLVGLAVGATLSVILAACGNSSDTRSATAGLPDVLQQLTANEWIFDRGASSIVTKDTNPITIVFSKAHILSGVTPCNAYKGTFALDNTDIKISHISQTLRACGAEAAADEHEYLTALQMARHVEPTNQDRLKLTGASNTKLSYDALRSTTLASATGKLSMTPKVLASKP